jgi:hypothetical protein
LNYESLFESVKEGARRKANHELQRRQHEFDLEILPKEYGGVMTVKEMLDDFRKNSKVHEENVQLITQQRIDLSLMQKVRASETGSFRKLDID